MRLFIMFMVMFVVLSGCATTGTSSPVPGSRIRPADLLEHTYQQYLGYVKNEFGCSSPRVVYASGFLEIPAGGMIESWQSDICGVNKNILVLLISDGVGGYMIAFGRDKEEG